MRRFHATSRAVVLVVSASIAVPAFAGSLDLGTGSTGISFGDSPRWNGIRINTVDRSVEQITGLNVTLWQASAEVGGTIDGLGIGLWGPRADRLRGIHLGIAGPRAHDHVRGLGIGLLGVASGEGQSHPDERRGDLSGVMLGGLGLGAGGDVRGIAIGGLGAGAGGDIRGLAIGGLGMGAGGNVVGVAIGGLGTGVGEDAWGLLVSGMGHGVGEDFHGIGLAGLGCGYGGDVTGLTIAGLGTGIGGTLRGAAIGGIGVGVTRSHGVTLGLAMTRGEVMRGITIAAYNRWDEQTDGLSIGLVNVTHALRGVQIGLLNIAWENPGWRRILPVLNWGT